MPSGRVHVDQSGKIEQTNFPSVIAGSNEEQRALLIPAQAKREILERLKRRGHESKAAVLMIFAAGLALLLRDWQQASIILIDDEYTGQQPAIKSRLLLYLERSKAAVSPDVIRFGRVGKSSPAHRLAIAVHRGRRAPDHIVTTGELWALLGKTKTPGAA